jgi:hypothetical protein
MSDEAQLGGHVRLSVDSVANNDCAFLEVKLFYIMV